MKNSGHLNHFDNCQVDEMPSQHRVVLLGRAGKSSYALLATGLQRRNCQIVRCSDWGDLNDAALKGTSLVFIFVDSFAGSDLFTKVASIIRSTIDVNIIPIVEYDDQEKAATLLELGCVDYLLAPFSETQLTSLLQRQEAALAAEDSFVTRSRAGRRLLSMAQRVALTRAPILITGETGTGKELMARYIHKFSSGTDAPFVAVNCAAIPEQMLESILFGYEKGAFTGATAAQPGKFELANGGTLLLDEIGELPLGLQAKLLRVLQEQKVERLGGRKETRLDVRIVAATNRDLQQEVAAGRFRADLMFRLDVLPLHIMPLRERKEDVLPLARRFIRQFAPREQPDKLLTDAACRALLAYDWPGNVRELENILQRAMVLRNGLYIQPQDLGLDVPPEHAAQQISAVPSGSEFAPSDGGGGKAALRASGKWAEYQHVMDTIRKFDGHKTKAAKSLGMTPRALRYRLNAMRKQGMPVPI